MKQISVNDFVNRTILDNGIRIVTEKMPFVRSVAMGVWVRAGSCDETSTNNGIAHFLEHMLFKGTETRSAKELAQSLESLGGALNGSTGKEVSVYTAHALDEHLEISVQVLADLVFNSRLAENDIELEKQVVLAEMAHAKEDPEEFVFDNFYKNIFSSHPLGYFIYGSERNITRFKRADLLDFFHKKYTADRIVLAASGNVNHNTFVEHCFKYFSAVNGTAIRQEKRDSLKGIKKFTTLPGTGFHQAHICMGFRTFGFSDLRKFPLALLDVLLGGGMSSRLFQNIREKYGFTYSVFSFVDLMAETGVFGAYLACDKRRVDESIILLEKEIEKIKDGDVTEHELNMTKSQVLGNLILSLESSGRRMKKIGENEIYNCRHRSLDDIILLVNNVIPNDIKNIAQELFVDSNKCITIISP